MPGGDRTGPAGMGYAARGGSVHPFVPQDGTFAPSMTAEQELDALEQQAEFFQDGLGQINKRIEQLEAESTKR